tara:strand:+ start:6739 stop:7935 length:1197 start_codon:yes stop_codon:yes gene_type:complete
MLNSINIFKKHQAQTFPYPSCLEIKSSSGSYILDVNDKKYLDFVAGVSACTLGHSNPIINKAIINQVNKYSHVMVYGEYIQSPQYELAFLLSKQLPKNLNTTYFTNSGTEAIEGAIKLAKRSNKRAEILSCINSYHGSTQGSLSVMGNENQKTNYRPLLPECNQIIYNDLNSVNKITSKTSAVVLEPIQAASGFIEIDINFLKEVRKKCIETGTLLIFDEIQTCYGRIGSLFASNYYNIYPDILCIAKGMGAGMPLGAFISSWELMNNFTSSPSLGHITTFGGHPVSCAASLACLKHLIGSDLISSIKNKEELFRKQLNHSLIKEIRGKGLMLAIELNNENLAKKLVDESLKRGLILFYFLLTKTAIRISPPLTISNDEIIKGCKIINFILEENKHLI